MTLVPWTTQISFTSALLLHTCITVLLKETSNLLEVARRLWIRRRCRSRKPGAKPRPVDRVASSIVLDAYTSILSCDEDGRLAELYFTNTGFVLLGVSLASSIVMNLFLSSTLLNILVASTFGLALLASLAMGKREVMLPILALRRAGRFIWADTPFVNFFSLIYVATVLNGQSTMRLEDYIILRSIATIELVFMKAQLAACNPETQVQLLRSLIDSEWVALPAGLDADASRRTYALPLRDDMITFTTSQRLSVMLFKTTLGFDGGCLQGRRGPAMCPLPNIGSCVGESALGWSIFRWSEDVMILADNPTVPQAAGWWTRWTVRLHGILLRRLGKVRVIYLIRTQSAAEDASVWHSNVNLVTGVSKAWLDTRFRIEPTEEMGVIA